MKIEKFGKGQVYLNIIVGVHGNEKAPLAGAALLRKYLVNKKIKQAFQIITANESALAINKRFVAVDLNRCFPGNRSGNYEEKLAAKLAAATATVEYNLDFHSTISKISKPYGIFSVYSRKLLGVMAKTGVKNWLFDSSESLIKFAVNSLAIEVGSESDSKSADNAFAIMKSVLISFKIIDDKIKLKPYQPRLYLIYHFMNQRIFSSLSNKLADFKYVKPGEVIGWLKNKQPLLAREGFYPILVADAMAIKKAKRIMIEK